MLRTIFNLPNTVISYLRKVWQELRQMDWLKPSEAFKLTFATIIISIFTVLLIALLDQIFVQIRDFIITAI